MIDIIYALLPPLQRQEGLTCMQHNTNKLPTLPQPAAEFDSPGTE